jgi:hypothetical protein
MKTSNLSFMAALSLAALFVVACGDDKPDPSKALTPADVVYLKQQRMQAMYGSTVTQTSTQTNTVVIQNTTTVNASGTSGAQ